MKSWSWSWSWHWHWRKRTPCCLLACIALAASASAPAQSGGFSFGVIGSASASASAPVAESSSGNDASTRPGPGTGQPSIDAALRDAIAASDNDSLAFVVVNGIKASTEPCTDKLYFQRKELFQSAKNGLIVTLGASDWSDCRTTRGQSNAIERLGRVRELFFADEFSFGASRLPLMHQASTPKYRSYTENLRWDIGAFAFATVHLPANNNDYLAAAGRNSEFEDRMVADRDWLQRVVSLAAQRNAAGIVLFCDADPLAPPAFMARIGFGGGRDGFVEIRKQLERLGQRFKGRILLVHAAPRAGSDTGAIIWQGNLGSVAARPGWLKITADPQLAVLFAAAPATPLLHALGQ